MADISAEGLQSSLHSDRAWRRREIGAAFQYASKADVGSSAALCRAFLLLQYAHWEGFVRYSVDRYLHLVAVRRLKFSELQHGFRLVPSSPLYSLIEKIQENGKDRDEALDELLEFGNLRFSKRHVCVNTQSNLRYRVLKELSGAVCVDLHSFVDEGSLDKLLADRRNEIAHGSWLVITKNDIAQMRDVCGVWMDQILNNLVNAASLESYRK